MQEPLGDPPKYHEHPYPPAQTGYGYPPAPGAQPGQYPAQPGYPPPPMTGYTGQNTTVVVSQPSYGPRDGSTIRYTQSPALIVCQHCQATVTTSMDYDIGLLTWAICGGLCVVGCFLGCCLIPFCIDGTKDVEHKCPNCQKVVGRFRHFS